MKQEQIKIILKWTVSVVIIAGVFGFAYWALIGKKYSILGDFLTIVKKPSNTVTIGIEVARTVKELEDLTGAVSSATLFFRMPEFERLKNFSVEIYSEPIGRENPFVPTSWRLKLEASEKEAKTIH